MTTRALYVAALLTFACNKEEKLAEQTRLEALRSAEQAARASHTEQAPQVPPSVDRATSAPATPPPQVVPPAAPPEPAPWVAKLAAMLKPGAKLPKVDDRSQGRNLYSVEIEGISSPTLSIYRNNTAAWRIIVSAVEGGGLDAEQFGSTTLCRGKEKSPTGYGSPLYRIETGPLAGSVVERQIDPEHPRGYQAIIVSPDYIRTDPQFTTWSVCLH